ncbi:hypothetical protein [Spiroplasma diminutum]|uniref:Transmembrane protein n=1 Tax=Spiroplasma diminutum CUAS-1 TaxID=1276221 RepID=S5M232_9MOLU|nr:hypothetical protein [Spiroplasma diminutum]AGR42132.1 hypothetical protein SDIMI_v3c04280 [Spiroplasma diminutum CUAS-1]
MKKILTTLLGAIFLSTQTLQVSGFVESEVTQYNYKNEIKTINNLSTFNDINYKSFIPPSQKQNNQQKVMYYGRVLKYYYANNIKLEDNIDFEVLFTESNNTNKSLAIQNLLASTINISIYGSSSDAEFFAETFSKWLNTPDEQKNKSWEITNHFFITVFPELLKNGSILNEAAESNIVNAVQRNIIGNKYDTTLDGKSGSLNLKYNINLTSYLSQASSYISSQTSVSIDQYNLNEISKNWFNDSYTKASENSIASFKEFNKNYYASFDELDEILNKNSLDSNSVSRLPYKKVYDNLEENYLISTPMFQGESEKWTKQDTQNLKDLTLFLYNMIYSITNNASWTQNILTGFIISPDYPLADTQEGVMGYTSTASYIQNQQVTSTAYSFIVLTGISLTFKEYNSQYTQGFWSSPSKYNVLIHEFGHVVDAFASKLNTYRNETYKNDISYKEMYSGNIFGDYTAQKQTFVEFISKPGVIIAILAGTTILIVFFTSFAVGNYRRKKNK